MRGDSELVHRFQRKFLKRFIGGTEMDLFQHFPDHDCTNQNLDHPSHAQIGIHPFPGRLYVVTILENPLRWRSRYANYWAFQKHVEDSGALLYTGEVAFGE